MICPYCGQENPEDVELCAFCGGSVLHPDEQPPAAIPQSQPLAEVLPGTEKPEPGFDLPPGPVPPGGAFYGNRVWWIFGCLIFICMISACLIAGWAAYRVSQNIGLIKTAPPNANLALTQVLSVNQEQIEAPPLSFTTQAPSLGIPLQTPSLLYFDDFSDPTSGWDRVNESDFVTDYYQGTYRILVNTTQSDSWANPGNRSYNNVIIEVDTVKNGGSEDNDFGVICRYLDTQHFYYAVISSDGFYGITKVTGESSQVLGWENLVFSDVIQQGAATNHLRFDCIGSVLTLYVNGQQLDQQADNEFSAGNVGLLAGTYKIPGTDILFDNFSVSSP